MSQATVSDAFRTPPRNMFSEKRDAALAAQQPQPQPTPQAAPQEQYQYVRPTAPVQQQPAQQYVQPDPTPTAQTLSPEDIGPASAPVYKTPEQYELEQLRAERQNNSAYFQQIQAQNEAMRQAIANLTQERDQLATAQQASNMEAVLNAQNFDELGVDADDARAIMKASVEATNGRINQLQQELAQQRRALEEAQRRNVADFQQMRRNELNAEILRAHPDYMEFKETPEYKNFMSQRAGGMSKTWDAIAADEYMAGNTAFIIDLLNKAKANRPSTKQVMSVAPVQTAGGAVAQAPTSGNTQYTLAELNSLMQMRRITPDEYRAHLKQMRAANLL